MATNKIDANSYLLSREGLDVPVREGPPRWGPTAGEQLPPNGYGAGKISASEYTDPERYARELDKVFRANWIVAAHGSELAQPGDYRRFEAFGETILIVRQADGSVKAFHNVCRHRGARLVSDDGGSSKGFVCPWHGFTYALDGRVRAIRDRKCFRAQDVEDLAAVPVRTAQWGGFVFINIDGRAPEFDEYLGEMGVELSPYRLDQHKFITRRSWDVKANWKIVADGFLELYHTPVTHATVDSSAFRFSEGAYTLLGRHSMMAYPFEPRYQQLLETRDHQQFAGVHFTVFPSNMINCHAEHSEVYTILPTGVNSATLTAWRVLRQGAPPEFYERMDQGWKMFCAVIDEDVAVDEEVGVVASSSGFIDTFTQLRECRIAHLHDTVNACLNG